MKIKYKAEIPDLKLLLNQRCFFISGMVILSFGLCSNILDNRPDKATPHTNTQFVTQLLRYPGRFTASNMNEIFSNQDLLRGIASIFFQGVR